MPFIVYLILICFLESLVISPLAHAGSSSRALLRSIEGERNVDRVPASINFNLRQGQNLAPQSQGKGALVTENKEEDQERAERFADKLKESAEERQRLEEENETSQSVGTAGLNKPTVAPTGVNGGTSTPPQAKRQAPPQNIKVSHKNRAPKRPTAGKSGGIKMDKVWFACVLVDPKHAGAANAGIKGLVEHAAGCGVVLQTFNFTLKQNYPASASAINAGAKAGCNLPDVFPEIKKASVQTIGMHDSSPGDMCGMPNVAGCAETGGGGGGGGKMTDAEKKQKQAGGHFGGQASGNVMASIVNGTGPGLLSHEMLGHNVMSKPNGGDYGNGIGEEKQASLYGPRQIYHAEAGGRPPTPFNEAGCAIMRSQSQDNTMGLEYEPDREFYYIPESDPALTKDLMSGKSFFSENPPVGPPAPPPIRPDRVPPRIEDPPSKTVSGPSGGSGAGHKLKNKINGTPDPQKVDEGAVTVAGPPGGNGNGDGKSELFMDEGLESESLGEEVTLSDDFFSEEGEADSNKVFVDEGAELALEDSFLENASGGGLSSDGSGSGAGSSSVDGEFDSDEIQSIALSGPAKSVRLGERINAEGELEFDPTFFNGIGLPIGPPPQKPREIKEFSDQ